MKNKSQITIFIIVGIAILVAVSAMVFLSLRKSADPSKEASGQGSSFAIERKGFQESFEHCSRTTVVNANKEFGLRNENVKEYEAYVSRYVKSCMSGYVYDLMSKGAKVTTSEISAEVLFFDEIISLKINYPISIEKDNQRFTLESYELTFSRTSTIRLDNPGDTMLISPDNSARILIRKGTQATDTAGNIIEAVSIKLLDKKFDGLENNIVVGNLVYEGLQDGITFSDPVQVSIDIRAKDYPSHINEDSLSIAWWDEKGKIWRSLPTNLEGGIATAEVDHFTKFAVVIGCSSSPAAPNKVEIQLPKLFKQKYEYRPRDKKFNEDEIEYSEYLGETYEKTCNQDGYWEENEDGTITPNREQFKKILANEAERLDYSIQEVSGESFVFGDGSCDMPVPVNQYCCCNSEGCEPEPMSKQGCWRLGDEFDIIDDPDSKNQEHFDQLKEEEGIDVSLLTEEEKKEYYMCQPGPYDNKDEYIFGYNSRECIGGKTEDGNGDQSILQINFKTNGDACVPSSFEATAKPEGEGCNFAAEGEIVDGEFLVKIETAVQEEPGSGYCAECTGFIEITGTGIESAGPLYTACENPNTPEITFNPNTNKLECNLCVELPGFEGLYVVSPIPFNGEPIETGQGITNTCQCTMSMVGTAYCDTYQICSLIEGVPTLTSWTPANNECQKCLDPFIKQTDPDCLIAVYPNEVGA